MSESVIVAAPCRDLSRNVKVGRIPARGRNRDRSFACLGTAELYLVVRLRASASVVGDRLGLQVQITVGGEAADQMHRRYAVALRIRGEPVVGGPETLAGLPVEQVSGHIQQHVGER